MSGTSARAGHRAQPVVKSVLVYRNGDPFFAGRRVIIHEKKVSSFDIFLREVTGGVQAPFGAVRNLYTPRTGHRICKLDQIQSGGNYVAGGQEAFKKLNYLDIGEIKKRPMEVVNTEVKLRHITRCQFLKPLKVFEEICFKVVQKTNLQTDVNESMIDQKLTHRVRNVNLHLGGESSPFLRGPGPGEGPMEDPGPVTSFYPEQHSQWEWTLERESEEVKPVIHSRINVSARFRKPLQEPCTIFLIANGDLRSPASRLLIPRKALNQWDHVLQMVTEKITLRSGAVHRLYTLEGKLVESGAELENGQFYVAVGRDKFKKLPYSELLFDKSTMTRSFGQKASSLPPIVGSRKSKGSGNDRQSKSTVGSSDNSSPQPPKRKGKKEDGNLEKPTKAKQNPKLKNSPPTIPDSDEGIFKAGAERSETRGAAEVQEDEETQVEIPVDQRPAEIVDEEEDGEKESKGGEKREEFSGVNGEAAEEGGREATAASAQDEEMPGLGEKQRSPARGLGGTDEENGEELDPVHGELREAVDEEIKSRGAGSEHEEADEDPQRPPRPEVKITAPPENDDNEQSKECAVVA